MVFNAVMITLGVLAALYAIVWLGVWGVLIAIMIAALIDWSGSGDGRQFPGRWHEK